MPSVLISLLPEILASLLYPMWIIFTILLLMGSSGSKRTFALILGGSLTRLLQGIIFGFVIGSAVAEDEAGESSNLTSILLLVVGIFLLITAVRAYLKEPDPDDPPPKWMEMVDRLTPAKVFLLGAGWVSLSPKLWLFTLSAISVIRDAYLPVSGSITAYAFYMIGCVLFSLIALLMVLLFPDKARAVLSRFQGWLNQNTRAIKIVISIVFGALFLYLGVSGLLT